MPDGMSLHLLLVLFFIFLVIIDQVAIFPGLVLFVFLVLFVQVVGDEIQVDGMRLRNLELGFAFRTAQNLAFFDFVFVNIDLGGTFRTTDHGSTLRKVVCKVAVRGPCPPLCSVLYTAGMKSTPVRGSTALSITTPQVEGSPEWPLPENTPNGQWLVSGAWSSTRAARSLFDVAANRCLANGLFLAELWS